jgi:hypothetical protein
VQVVPAPCRCSLYIHVYELDVLSGGRECGPDPRVDRGGCHVRGATGKHRGGCYQGECYLFHILSVAPSHDVAVAFRSQVRDG